MIPPFRPMNMKWLFMMAEQHIKNTKHIASAMKLTEFLLSRSDQPPPIQLIEDDSECQNEELKEFFELLSLEVFNLSNQPEEFDSQKSDYDYIKTNKVHFLEYQEYQNDVDLINMEEVESVDLDEIADECELFPRMLIDDMFSYRPKRC